MPSPPDRVAISIMNIEIMWYGILITFALALAVFIAYKRANRYGIKPERVLDYAVFCIPAGLIGARLYYILFNMGYYSKNPEEIINIRGGGLAIHGALILGFLTAFILCRIWDIKPLNALDLGAPSIAIAQAIGRWGNYFNQEAHGGPTDLPWGIMIDGVKVHPAFLYESLWCLLIFIALLRIGKNRKFHGQIFLLYCILYSFERFFVEQLRTDSLFLFGQYKQAQVLSVIVVVVGVIAYVYLYRKGDKNDDVISFAPIVEADGTDSGSKENRDIDPLVTAPDYDNAWDHEDDAEGGKEAAESVGHTSEPDGVVDEVDADAEDDMEAKASVGDVVDPGIVIDENDISHSREMVADGCDQDRKLKCRKT